MACVSPSRIQVGELYQMISCGKCKYCRIRRKLAWAGRLVLERQEHIHARFLTLTYAEDPGVLDYKHIQDFAERYRYHYGSFRFFAVGEYGSNHDRGHWHLIVYGHPPEAIGHLHGFKAWKHGFVYDGDCSLQSINYVAGYTLKDTHPVRRALTRMSLRPGLGLPTIGKFAKETASRVGYLERWPNRFYIGSKFYPLTQGGLNHFKTTYLNAGGRPPVDTDPELADWEARAHATLLGTRIQSEAEAKRLLDMEKPDGTIKGRTAALRKTRF